MADFPSSPLPSYPVEVSAPEPDVAISKHRDGSEQRRLKGQGDKRTFKLKFGSSMPLTYAEMTALYNHYLGQSGTALSFNWLHPEWGVTIKVRYAARPSFSHQGYNAYQMSIDLQEVSA